MNSLPQQSHTVDELTHSIPTIIKFGLVGTLIVWLMTILSTCRKFEFRNIHNKRYFNFLPFRLGVSSGKRDQLELDISNQAGSRIWVKESICSGTKHQHTVIASLGQLCASSVKMLVHRALGTGKFLIGVLLLGAVMLFHPLGSMQAVAGIGGQTELTTGGYNDKSPIQDFGGVNNELFLLDNPILNRNVDELPLDNTEIKIDATPESASPTLDSQDLIQLAQSSAPQVTLQGASTAFFNPNRSSYPRNFLLPEGGGETTIWIMFHIPQSVARNFTINYTISQRQGDNFLKAGDQTRTLNTASIPDTARYLNIFGRHQFYDSFIISGDGTDEDNGIITITIQDGGSAYSIASNVAERSAIVNVIDDDAGAFTPEVTLVGAGTTESFAENNFSRSVNITEGNPVTSTSPHTNTTQTIYFLMHIPNSVTANFIIKFQVTQESGDFLVGGTNDREFALATDTNVRTHDDTSNSKLYIRHKFEITNDEVEEIDGVIKLTLKNRTGYTISQTATDNVATINVADDDAPRISIETNHGTVQEGALTSLTFTLRASKVPSESIDIRVIVSESGDVIATSSEGPRTIPMTAITKSDTIMLENDDDDEAHSTIMLQIATFDGAKYVPVSNTTVNDQNNPTSIISIIVQDDEVPAITISGPSSISDDTDNNQATNTMATYTLNADPIPYTNIDIIVTITSVPNETNDTLFSGPAERTIQMLRTDPTQGEKSFPIEILGAGLGGTLTVALKTAPAGNIYKHGSPASISTTINDEDANPDGPIIELVPLTATSITEGSTIEFNFQVAAGATVTTALSVNINVTDGDSDYIDGTTPTTVTIPTTSSNTPSACGIRRICISTAEDNFDEADGSIMVTIQQGRKNPSNKNYQISATSSKVTQRITVTDNDEPKVSITGPSGAVSESAGSFDFTLTATPRPHKNLMINVTIAEAGGDFYNGQTTLMVPMPTSAINNPTTTATGTITLVNDDVDEANGTLTLQVDTGTDYAPVANPTQTTDPQHTITVNIEDDEVPKVSVTAPGSVTEDAGSFMFTLSATPPPYQPISISVSITGTSMIYAGQAIVSVRMLTDGTAMEPISIVDNDLDNANRSITISISTGSGYAPVENPTQSSDPQHTVTVTVTDDEIPAISVTGPDSITDVVDGTTTGNTLTFTVTADPVPHTQLIIPIFVRQELRTANRELLYVGARAGTAGIYGTLVGSVNISGSQNSASFPITLINSSGGTITFMLSTPLSNSNYKLSETKPTSKITSIIDPDSAPTSNAPVIELAPLSSTSVVEGNTATFNLQVANNQAINSALRVTINVTQTEGFVRSTDDLGIKVIDFPTTGMVSVPIETNGNSVNEPDGSIRIVIIQGYSTPANENYKISTTDSKVSQTIMVLDDDEPKISIAGPSGGVSESTGMFNFTLTATVSPYQEIMVNINITEAGGDFYNGLADLMVAMTTTSVTETITLENDSDDEADGTLTLQVKTGTGYAPVANPTQGSDPQHTIIVNIQDDEVPKVSLTAPGSVDEDDGSFTLILSATPPPYQDITISVSVSGPSSVYAGLAIVPVVMTETGRAEEIINIIDNDIDNTNHTITISVSTGSGYDPVADPAQSTDPQHTIEVIVEDDEVPKISISGENRVNEDDDAVFSIVADINPAEDLTINVSITQTPFVANQNLYSGAATRVVNMSATTPPLGRASLTLDLLDMSGGTITVTIDTHPDGKYEPADPGNSHKIQVIDPDSPPSNNAPVIEILPVSVAAVEEGDPAIFNFQVATGQTLSTALEIEILITQDGTFLQVSTPDRVVDIPTSGTGSISVQTVDDDTDEADGSITVQIFQGRANPPEKNYRIDTSQTTGVNPKVVQTIMVQDNDIPQISISSISETAAETDSSFAYNLSANIPPYQDIMIEVNVTESGNVIDGTPVTMITMDTSGMAMGTIMLHNDDIDELDSTITIQVVEETNAGYEPVAESTPNADKSNTIAILVADDDIPELTITAGANVFEQDAFFANFTISADIFPSNGLAVRYTPRSNNFLASNVSGTTVTTIPPLIFIPTGDTFSANLMVNIDKDEVDDPPGTIEVTLEDDGKSNSTYSLGSTVTASVNVFESSEYELQIENSFIVEGDEGSPKLMQFEVTLSPAAREPITVKWHTIIDQGDNATLGDDFFGSPRDGGTLEFALGATTPTQQLAITIFPDTDIEPTESFTIIINEPSLPTINLANARAKGFIIDNDSESTQTEIAIVASSSPIVAGNPANFILFSSQELPAEGLNINIEVTPVGSFIAWRIPQSFNMTERVDTLQIPTVDDETHEGTGSISITVVENLPSYTVVGERESDQVIIYHPTTTPENQARISVAQLAVGSILSVLNEPQGTAPPTLATESAPALVPPSVSIAAVNNTIDEGATAKFLITSRNGTNSTNISVSFQVNHVRVQVELPGAMNVQLGGHDAVSIAIPTINNNHANDEDGYIAVSLTEDPSYLITENKGNAVVNISDAIDRQQRQTEITAHAQAFLPDLTGRMGASNLGIVSNRITQGFSENANQVLELGGHSSLTGMLTASGEIINENSTTLKSFLGDSSFAMSLITGDEFAVPTTLWGIGDLQDFSSATSNRTIDWSGDLFTGHIGIDALINDGLLTGISASVSESEVEFDNSTTNEIQFNVRTTSLNPYLGWTSRNRNSEFHATIGLGHGEIGIKQESYEDSTLDSKSYSFGLNGNQVLFASNSIANGTTKLSIKGDSWFAHQFIVGRDGILTDIHTNAQHLRIRTEGSHQFDFASGSTFSPLISIGIRNDVKDQQSVLGVELTSSADYNNPVGVTIAGTGNMLVGQENQVQKVTISSSLNYDRNTDNQGFIVDISPTLGYVDENIQDTLWSSDILVSNFENGQYSNGASLNSEFGYGFEFLQGDGLVTPISGFEISSNQGYEYEVGTRLSLGSNANFELSGIQSKNTSGSNSSTVRLEGRFNW